MLLTAGVLALAALWLLARFRFQDGPVTPNPLPAVLTQLRTPPRYEDLAAEVARLQSRLDGVVVAIDPIDAADSSPSRLAALPLGDGTGVALVSGDVAIDEPRLLARDPASGLALVRVDDELSDPPAIWLPRRLDQPRYLIASDVSAAGLSFGPTFMPSLDPVASALWSDPLWAIPPGSRLPAGTFLFTTDAELVGLVIEHAGGRAVVPAATVLAEAADLLARPPAPTGTIGIDVQALTDPIKSATGARLGVIVTRVQPDGPAAGDVLVGDVIEVLDGVPLTRREQWDVRIARLAAGDAVVARVRRRGEIVEVPLAAAAASDPADASALGLTLRARAGVGAEVSRVDRGSAADRAHLAVGDLITLIGDVHAPTPAQVSRAFTSAPEGRRVIVAITRGDGHFVTTLER